MENDTAVWDIPGNMPSLPTWLIMTVDKNVHTPPLVEVLKSEKTQLELNHNRILHSSLRRPVFVLVQSVSLYPFLLSKYH